jgi:glutamine synthetase
LLEGKAGRRGRPLQREAAAVFDEHTPERWEDHRRDHRRNQAVDPGADFRDMVMHALMDCGVEIDGHRQSDGDTAKGQLQLSETDLLTLCDRLLITKHVVKRAAARVGKVATFMPVPPGVRGAAGLRVQLALDKYEASVLAGAGFAGLSDAGLHAIGGLLRHAGPVSALTNATTNSYARLTGNWGAPTQVAYSESLATSAVRISSNNPAMRSKQLELRTPDALCNPYLALSATLMAVIDGMQNKLQPGDPLVAGQAADESLQSTAFPPLPTSLGEALQRLEEDGEFLLRGDVFTEELVSAWLAYKRTRELAPLRAQPHPLEVAMYFDA